MALGLIVVGLVLTLAGIVCGCVAYRQALRENEGGSVWPWGTRQVHRASYTLRRLLRRKRTAQVVKIGAAGEIDWAGPIRPIQSGLPVPEDLSLQEQIRLLVARVQQVETEAAKDREQHGEQVRALRAEVDEQHQRLRGADEALRAKARSDAIRGVRLQILGLILVGSGTFLMALPTLFPYMGW